jgi:hypothetical protein
MTQVTRVGPGILSTYGRSAVLRNHDTKIIACASSTERLAASCTAAAPAVRCSPAAAVSRSSSTSTRCRHVVRAAAEAEAEAASPAQLQMQLQRKEAELAAMFNSGQPMPKVRCRLHAVPALAMCAIALGWRCTVDYYIDSLSSCIV